DDGVCVLDAETGQERGRFAGGFAWCFSFSPDGRTLATGELDGTILLWDVSKLRPKDEPVEITDSLWSDLAGEAPKAYQAIEKLGHAGEGGVAFLRERLKPAKAAEKKKLDTLFADVESAKYAVRQKAAAELAGLDLTAEVLRERLKATNSAEARAAIS